MDSHYDCDMFWISRSIPIGILIMLIISEKLYHEMAAISEPLKSILVGTFFVSTSVVVMAIYNKFQPPDDHIDP